MNLNHFKKLSITLISLIALCGIGTVASANSTQDNKPSTPTVNIKAKQPATSTQVNEPNTPTANSKTTQPTNSTQANKPNASAESSINLANQTQQDAFTRSLQQYDQQNNVHPLSLLLGRRRHYYPYVHPDTYFDGHTQLLGPDQIPNLAGAGMIDWAKKLTNQ